MENERLTAIAVDDEVSTRKLLQVLLDWNSLGISFIGEASNGNEALDLIETLKPNIVFTDINMPYMDGLELARLTKESDPFIKVVILTAYPEFEYAKKSVKIGVHDFLLKPIQQDVLQKLAVELKEAIYQEASHWIEFRKIKSELLENTNELKGKFLLDLLVGTSTAEQLNRRFEYLYGEPFHSSCSVAVLDVPAEPNDEEEKHLVRGMGCKRLVEVLVQEREGINVFQDHSGRVVIVSWEAETELERIGEQAIRAIKDKMGYSASIGIGNVYETLDRLKDSYKEALEALRFGRLHGGEQVVSFQEDIRLADAPMELNLSEMEEIIFFVRTGIKEQAVQAIQKLFQTLAASRSATIEQAYSYGVQFFSLLIVAMSELGSSKHRTDLLNGRVYSRMFGCQTFREVADLLTELAEEAADQIKGSRHKKKTGIIDEVHAYLTEEFRSPEVSLASVSQRFQLNPSYLSRIFKQEMSQSFTDYLLKLRIDEAIRLMDETDWKAYQIAEKVGILDPYYFSHRFKKVTGVSIQEYKRASQK